MHMGDALISPIVGGTMLAASAGLLTYSAIKSRKNIDEKKIPLMGVMGAFVFAAQMVNFAIPGTGSSGHLGGGMLLASLLGPLPGFIVMSIILIIQCLFFADGGLLALGCNIFNLGFFTCFVAYPLIFKPIIKKGFSRGRIILASILSAVIGLQLGSFAVVLETLLSGNTDLPFNAFVLLMQPIHLAIGIVEGIVIAAVLLFVKQYKPDLLENTAKASDKKYKRFIAIFAAITLIVGCGISMLASSNPDGLEWAIFNITKTEEYEKDSQVNQAAANIQDKTAFLADYGANLDSVGTPVSGFVGAGIVLGVACLSGYFIHLKKKKTS